MQYLLIRSKRRSVGAQIKEGKLVVHAPLFMSVEEIEGFLLRHKVWIDRHLEADRERREVAAQSAKLTPDEVQSLMRQAREYIPLRVQYYAPIVGVTYGKVAIRAQRSRWGSCNAKGDLSFNCLLMLAPPEVLDSIVVHELCHRKQMNHSRRFYAAVLRVCPDYYKNRKWLKENGYLLFAKLGK